MPRTQPEDPNVIQVEISNDPVAKPSYDSSIGISEKSIRRNFIRKVLGIIFCQMMVSVAFVLAALFIDAFKTFQSENVYLFLVAIFVEILLFIMLICNKQLCKRVPYNYIVLFIFTIAVSYILSFICARTKPEAVLVATIATSLIVILLGLFTCLSNRDLTTNVGILLYLPVGGIFLILFLSVWPIYIVQIVICLIVVLIFSAFLAYDLQKLSGKFGIEYSIDDYVFAALMIYIDIIMIFKNLLYIFGGSR